jgi:hypothetical protein
VGPSPPHPTADYVGGLGKDLNQMNYPAAELRSIKMNFYLFNPDAEHRGILLIKSIFESKKSDCPASSQQGIYQI